MIDGKGNSIFSQSKIWQLQSSYFTESGIDSWSSGAVPHYITIDPKEKIVAVFMTQEAAFSMEYHNKMKQLVYQALVD
jgi:CubicO group peptidase (beta-lactamase class C family)|tara:strand:+ start:735 stop:968 length:234 start_codon:yes stop_codon:yes gene_type:complete